MVEPFIFRSIDSWLEGFSIIPIRPHIAKPYVGFNCAPFEKRQPTIHELFSWSNDLRYRNAGVGLVVAYSPDRRKTLATIRKMDLDREMHIPVYILMKLKKAIRRRAKKS